MSEQTRQERAPQGPPISEAEYRTRSRRSFLVGGAGAVAGLLGWRYVQGSPADDNVPGVPRDQLERNEDLWSALYDDGRTVPEHAVGDARPLRVNGTRGMLNAVDVDAWRLAVEGPDGETLDQLDLDDVAGMGERDLVVLHKCIEGWSNVTHWTGVPFATFAAGYLDRIGRRPRYVSLTTINRGYYVGLDLEAAMHPQVLLGTGLDGAPLDSDHGAPLRLVSPIHYGIKSIKQIGAIRFTDERPDDYWAERGYDWHSQH